MRKNIWKLVSAIVFLFLSIIACARPVNYPTVTPAGTSIPTQTAIPINLALNMCVKLNHDATLYDDTSGHWSHISYVNMPKETKFIYLGGKVDDYIYVSYGDKLGWILINYISPCP